MMMPVVVPAIVCPAQDIDAMLGGTLIFDRGARKEAGELLARLRLHVVAGLRGASGAAVRTPDATAEERRRRLKWPEEQALLDRLWGGRRVRSDVRALAEGRAARELLRERLRERLLEIVRATPALRDAPGGDVATARMLADNLLASL